MADEAQEEVLKLDVWEGDWELPSVDPNCLAALAYCRFSGVPVKVQKTNNPWKSPTGVLPVMRHGNVVETKISNIFCYLRKQNWGSDFNLSTKQCADVVAYISLLEKKLLPAVLHAWWLDNQTYEEVTRPWFARASPFPLNFFVPGQCQKKANFRVNVIKGSQSIEQKEVEAKLYKDAKECLNHLSYKLGTSDFFFGDSPSSLDAIVFGYIAPLVRAPLSTNALTSHLRGCDNLTLLCTRIMSRFFPLTPEELEEKRRKQAEETPQEFPNKRRDMILAGIFGISSMVLYAFVSGLVRVEIVDDPSPDT